MHLIIFSCPAKSRLLYPVSHVLLGFCFPLSNFTIVLDCNFGLTGEPWKKLTKIPAHSQVVCDTTGDLETVLEQHTCLFNLFLNFSMNLLFATARDRMLKQLGLCTVTTSHSCLLSTPLQVISLVSSCSAILKTVLINFLL